MNTTYCSSSHNIYELSLANIVFQPYIFIIISVISNNVLNFLLNLCTKFIFQTNIVNYCFSRDYINEKNNADIETMYMKSNLLKLTFDLVIGSALYFDICQKIYYLNDIQPFHKFFLIYIKWLNSGIVSTYSNNVIYYFYNHSYISTCILKFFDHSEIQKYQQSQQSQQSQNTKIQLFLGCFNLHGTIYYYEKIVFAQLLPFCVFMLPTLFIFSPILICAIIGLFIAASVISLFVFSIFIRPLKDSNKKIYCTNLLILILGKIFISITIALLFQTVANYAYLFMTGTSWTNTYIIDYNLRNVECYLNDIFNKIYNIQNSLPVIIHIF